MNNRQRKKFEKKLNNKTYIRYHLELVFAELIAITKEARGDW